MAKSNTVSLVALALGVAPLASLSLYLAAVGLLVAVVVLRRNEVMAKVAIVVCLAGLIFSPLFSVFVYDLLLSVLYRP